MSDTPVNLTSSGPPETVLDPPPAAARATLEQALAAEPDDQRDLVAAVAAEWPRNLDAWAALGRLTDDTIESYAYFRVGYHRGLDTLRGAGWRGSGYVRWAHPTNLGFLRCLLGLQRAAHDIGERDEAERCLQFLAQLDPAGVPGDE